MTNKDKHIVASQKLADRPIDELGSLDSDYEDLMYAAEHVSVGIKRFALCIDATSSMGGEWRRAREALKTAVNYIKDNSRCPISVKIVGYRDHVDDPKEYITECSDWSDEVEYLHNFISEMRCHGGGDYPESIGHGLREALAGQLPVSQIILIGDAAGKTGSMGFDEAISCREHNCPIYALYTNNYDEALKRHFEKLAHLSGGKAFLLDASANMSDILTVLIASNKALQITYQATSIEGRRMAKELA